MGHGGGHHVVRQHFQDAIPRGDHVARGVGGGYVRLNAEQAGVRSVLDRGEDFDITGEFAGECDRRGEHPGGIGVAGGGIQLHEQRTAGQA